MRTPLEYLEHCRLLLILSRIVEAYQLIEAYADDRKGYIRAQLTLINGDFVEVAEYFVATPKGVRTEDYRFQWMDGRRQSLRCRWDNTPHFPELPGFPHHIHNGEEANVKPGKPMTLEKVLEEIAGKLETGDRTEKSQSPDTP